MEFDGIVSNCIQLKHAQNFKPLYEKKFGFSNLLSNNNFVLKWSKPRPGCLKFGKQNIVFNDAQRKIKLFDDYFYAIHYDKKNTL